MIDGTSFFMFIYLENTKIYVKTNEMMITVVDLLWVTWVFVYKSE
jgi:hypothetical protein